MFITSVQGPVAHNRIKKVIWQIALKTHTVKDANPGFWWHFSAFISTAGDRHERGERVRMTCSSESNPGLLWQGLTLPGELSGAPTVPGFIQCSNSLITNAAVWDVAQFLKWLFGFACSYFAFKLEQMTYLECMGICIWHVNVVAKYVWAQDENLILFV